jgi:hypothetical protein
VLEPAQEIRAIDRESTPSIIKSVRRRVVFVAKLRTSSRPNIPPPVDRRAPKLDAGAAAVGAVVEMVRVVLPWLLPFRFTAAGLNEHAANEGTPEVQAKLTLPAKPFVDVKLMV